MQSQAATPISHPKQTIDVIGVENDLLGIAQAERMFQAEHRFYASLDDLLSSGAMNMKKSGRDGYTYEAAEFRPAASESSRVARATPGCTNYSIEQTIEVRPAP